MKGSFIKDIKPLGFMWETDDPFLFCAHHRDSYPAGNGKMGPAASLSGRSLGQDFQLKDGWRMYHGLHVPGFPEHPHRGFETVTIVLNGFVDHFDSAGAAGRYGPGDVQWMTAGRGLQHAEMFPLVDEENPNPLELFQIWLNLPKESKMVEPDYKMLWADSIPLYKYKDSKGHSVSIRIIAGEFLGEHAPAPTPDSWAATDGNKVGIWLITLEPNAELILPPVELRVKRTIYFYEGSSVNIAGVDIPGCHSAITSPGHGVPIKNGPEESRFLVLQGKPIEQPVAQYGPFVMNTQQEIEQAFEDYRSTRFGGWPWDRSDPVHSSSQTRFARYSDGREELK